MKNQNPAVKSREVVQVIYFDKNGRFTANHSKVAKVVTKPIPAKKGKGYKLYKQVESVDLDGKPGGAKAIITRRGNGYVVVIRDPSLEAEKLKAKAKGETITLAAIAGYEKDLKRMALKDYLERQRSQKAAAALERSFKSDQAKKAAKTRATKKNTVTAEQRKQAQNQAKALEVRIKNAKSELAKAKTTKQKETLRGRIKRWSKAQTQLEKIAQGKAYKFPGAAATR